MKKTLMACILVLLLTSWFAYALGYHHGSRNERRAWESTVEVNLDSEQRVRGISYRHPHSGIVMTKWGAAVNVPDPRNLPVK